MSTLVAISANEIKQYRTGIETLPALLDSLGSKDIEAMATINERKGRYTAQVRLRGFKPLAKTFGTREQAAAWAKSTEAILLNDNGVAEPDPQSCLEGAYASCGVYFLYRGAECIYVGQSLNIHKRVSDHRKRIAFDVYSWTPVAPEQLQMVEQMFIGALRPALNLVHTGRKKTALQDGDHP